MQNVVRIITLAVAVSAALLTSSCNKASDPQATSAQTATLSGQITPASAVTTVTATDASGKATTATPGSTGAYSFPGLALGAYTLTFTAAAGYATPASQAVTLAAGGTTAAATTATVAPASASFTAGSTAVTATYIFSQTLAGDRFLTFTVSPGGAPGPTLGIDLAGLTPIVGSYSLTGSAYGYSAYYMGADYQTYYSDGNSPTGTVKSGTLVITGVNPTLRRFSGTFTFVGYGTTNSGAYVSKPVTNGVFANVSY
ncbi:MAG: hypothetical protein M3Y54_15255 [Bacteroidota bacterium]|nr:hypothetical protein [Bacteroidota bacterium]